MPCRRISSTRKPLLACCRFSRLCASVDLLTRLCEKDRSSRSSLYRRAGSMGTVRFRSLSNRARSMRKRECDEKKPQRGFGLGTRSFGDLI